MAQRIRNFTPRRGKPRLYPWDKWADGSAWRIRRGDDFQIEPSNMAAVIRSRAYADGQRATAVVDGDTIEFRFYSPDGDGAVAA